MPRGPRKELPNRLLYTVMGVPMASTFAWGAQISMPFPFDEAREPTVVSADLSSPRRSLAKNLRFRQKACGPS
jgi:hypothetical protein